MQGLIEFPDDRGLYISPCEVASGKFEPTIKKEEANMVTVSCNNVLGENIVTCKHPNKEEFLEEVNGLPLHSIELSTGIDDLPFYMPILDLASTKLGGIPSYLPVVGITLKDILLHGGAVQIAGAYHEKQKIAFRSEILKSKSFKGKKTLLFLSGTDTLIETVWHQRDACNLFPNIQQMGFEAVGGINFSVFDGECAFAQALNQKRSLYSASLLEQNGTNAIPHVYAINQFHIDRWIEWFKKNPQVNLFTINCQLQRSREDIGQIITTVKAILRRFPLLRVVLEGFRLSQIHQFGSLIDRIHLAEKTPVKYAYMRREIVFDNLTSTLHEVKRSPKSPSQLIINNITSRYLFLDNLRNKILQRSIKPSVKQQL